MTGSCRTSLPSSQPFSLPKPPRRDDTRKQWIRSNLFILIIRVIRFRPLCSVLQLAQIPLQQQDLLQQVIALDKAIGGDPIATLALTSSLLQRMRQQSMDEMNWL